MEVSVAGFNALYRLIGPAGLALCVVALFALYVGLWQLFYMSAVWRNFKHDFLDLEKGRDRCLRDIDPNRANPLIRIIYDIVSTHSHRCHLPASGTSRHRLGDGGRFPQHE